MKKLFIILMSFGLLLAVTTSSLNAQTISVSGTITSDLVHLSYTPHGVTAQFKDVWTGGIEGNGHTHIFSSVLIDPQTGYIIDVISKVHIFTPQGNLILDGVGTVTYGVNLHVESTIRQGTGIYQNASGTLSSDGIIGPDGQVSNYTGSITLSQ
jgi:hypothetical protein